MRTISPVNWKTGWTRKESKQMKTINGIFWIAGYMLFGLMGLITAATATVLITHWDGVVKVLLGA